MTITVGGAPQTKGPRAHAQGNDTVTIVVVVVVVDSHIQRIFLATEEITVTQQVSLRSIKYQSRLWSQRGYEGQWVTPW